MKKLIFVLFLLLSCYQISAQESVIDTVYVDNQLEKSSRTSKIIRLNTDQILQNATSLSDLLRFQSNIYVKENGRGATSSPSFRGTTAQQTAFIWNGININSPFLGQGDLNNMSVLGMNQIDIKYGGGSVLYGSGAIGGSVHFNNIFKYNQGWKNQIFGEYASYNTINTLYKSTFSNDALSVQFSLARLQSDNDYEVKEKYYRNRSGAYQNSTFNLGISYKLSLHNELYWQSQLFDGVQNYALLSEFSTPTKYESQTFRSLLGWRLKGEKISNDFKIAYITDDYQYFSDANINDSKSGGTSGQYIVKTDFSYALSDQSSVNTILEYNYITSESFKTNRLPANRDQGSLTVLYRNNEFKNLSLEAGAKKDFVEDFSSPYLFSAGLKYVHKHWYQLKINLSKNFRAPSFNDLYWQPGGNLNLKSETSHQAEFSQILKLKNWKLSVTPYIIDINDMIRWIPDVSGMYAATNTEKVKSLGLETQLGYDYIRNNHQIKLQASYAYTKSTDENLNKQLPYVPFHNFNAYISYRYKKYELFAQSTWNGKTYSDSQESERLALDAFTVINTGIVIEVIRNTRLGIKANNITNQVYRTIYGYYMPKRNFAINMNFNF